MTAYPHLLAPIRLGQREAKSRIMRLATTTNLGEANKPGRRLLEHYKVVAAGGAGTIVTESLRMFPQDTFPAGAIAIHDRAVLPGLRRIADVCHKAGALLIGQLNTAGRQHTSSRIPGWMIAPSAIACPRSGGVPRALSTEEVGEVIERFAICAAHCIEAGMDGVEIHGAQGHLIQQFLSPFSNRRTDRYGGSAENRMRFAREILARVRERIGPAAVIGYRMGVEEFTEGGLDVEQTLAIARALVADRVIDYLSLAQGNFNSIETHLPDRHTPPLGYRDLQARFKAAAGTVPTVMSARILTPEQADAVVASGDADMVGLCRALIVDPDWPRKAARGESAQIRTCIACNHCWGAISAGESLVCAVNPVTGREAALKPVKRSGQPRRVVVVGGGPGGLEAARAAALQGHEVTLLEQEAVVGGRLRDCGRVRRLEEMARLVEQMEAAALAAGVAIRMGERATPAGILGLAPDAVILAIGAEAAAAALPGDGSVPVLAPHGAWLEAGVEGRHVVVMDEDGAHWTAAVVEGLIQRGARITLVTRFFEAFRELPIVSRITALRALDAAGGTIRTSTAVAGVSNGAASLAHYLTGRREQIEDVAAVAWIGAATPRSGLAEALVAGGLERARMQTIGDAVSPRRLVHAIGEGHAAGRRVGG